MSLILDALKKSEQERRRERGPDLQTIHQATTTASRPSNKRWGWIAVVLINGIAVGGWWWFQRGEVPPAVVASSDTTAPVSSTATVAPPVESPVQPEKPLAQEEPQFTRMEPRTSVAAPRVDATTPVEEFTDLPPDVRSGLPAMTFSFHVYSTDPHNRTIIINSQRLREGEAVSAGLALEAITEDGVILAMDHRRVHINVLTGW